MTFEQFEEFVLSDECYWNHDVSFIDEFGLQHYPIFEDNFQYQIETAKKIAEQKVTIKVEQMERRYHWKDRTIHFFYNPINGPTFDTHIDPTDVIIDCHDGIKYMEVNGKEHKLVPGDKLLIHAGSPHKALNYEKALMASHGILDTETTNRICKDNRDL